MVRRGHCEGFDIRRHPNGAVVPFKKKNSKIGSRSTWSPWKKQSINLGRTLATSYKLTVRPNLVKPVECTAYLKEA